MSIEDAFGSFAVRPGELTIKSEIGKGHFAIVYLGSLRGTEVAVKKLKHRLVNHEQMRKFLEEAEFSRRQNHPNLIQLLGLCVDEESFPMLIYERLTTDLETLMKTKSFPFCSDVPSEQEIVHRLRIARDTARGMAWLHGQCPALVHRDLKPANLLLTSTGCVKITDYGLSQLLTEGCHARDERGRGKGSPLWMAPEVLRTSGFDKSIDVYSFGIVLWQILTGEVNPFPGESDIVAFTRHICQGKRPDLSKLPPYPELRDLCVKCWSGNPAERPSFPEIVSELCKFIGNIIFPAPFVAEWWGRTFGEIDSIDWDTFVAKANEENKEEISSLASETSSFGLGLEAFSVSSNTIREQGFEVMKRIFEQSQGKSSLLRVRSDDFGNLLKWVINLTPAVELTSSFLDSVLVRVYTLSQLGYFFGFISAGEAQSKVSPCVPGTFLLRFSSTMPGVFSVTYLSSVDGERKVRNTRILFNPTTRLFSFEAPRADGTIISDPSFTGLVEKGKMIGLTAPLKDSPLSLGLVKPDNVYVKVFTN